jgi:hypothetical protein
VRPNRLRHEIVEDILFAAVRRADESDASMYGFEIRIAGFQGHGIISGSMKKLGIRHKA